MTQPRLGLVLDLVLLASSTIVESWPQCAKDWFWCTKKNNKGHWILLYFLLCLKITFALDKIITVAFSFVTFYTTRTHNKICSTNSLFSSTHNPIFSSKHYSNSIFLCSNYCSFNRKSYVFEHNSRNLDFSVRITYFRTQLIRLLRTFHKKTVQFEQICSITVWFCYAVVVDIALSFLFSIS